MKTVTIVSEVDRDACRGCLTCTKVCPVYAITVQNKKAVVNLDKCMGCANCADRCPYHAIKMVKRAEPRTVGVDVSHYDYKKIRVLCEKAHLNPEQVICYCTGVRAEEVAAAILGGAKTPEEISLLTGIRTGCTIECNQPLLRLIQAAGLPLKRNKNGWQWYGITVTAWDLPDKVKEQYGKRFYFDEDRALLDRVVHSSGSEGEK